MAPTVLLMFLQTLETLPLKFCLCIIEQSPLVFQCLARDTIHLIPLRHLVRRPGLLCLIFESTHFSAYFPLRTSLYLVQLQHELYHELLARIIELFFRSLPVGSSKLVCLASASKHVALPIHADNCERSLPLCSFVYF